MTDAKRAILDQTPDNTLIVADMQEMPRAGSTDHFSLRQVKGFT